ncbi:MAG: pyroglutamyl-peptidase I [Hyphomicrobiales bacterium]|nr:pyroglutamyl-peptidase I [Hyphomicrobiales bacterium]
MLRILVTGFGPFPGVPVNPSQLVVEALPDTGAGAELVRRILPTEYRAIRDQIDRLVSELRPDIVLGTGVCRDPWFRLETVARNHGNSEHPDNSGAVRSGPIEEGGPDTYGTTLPVDTIYARLMARNHDIKVSDNAGSYVCNYGFYRSCHRIAELGIDARYGFLHLPAHDPSVDPEHQTNRLKDAVCTVLKAAVED